MRVLLVFVLLHVFSLLMPHSALLFGQNNDEFLHGLYDKLHDSPTQRKFHKIQPMPIGCVYLQVPGHGEKEMREHFRTMKKLGFNCLKQIMTCPGTTIEQVQLIALEEGINPFWYESGGWQTVDEDLLKKLKLPINSSMESLRANPAFLKYQENILRKRIERTIEYIKTSPDKKRPPERAVAYEPEVGPRGFELSDKGKTLFVEWVKKQYVSIDTLNKAWNMNHVGISPLNDRVFADWNDFETNWQKVGDNEYRHLRDILRFKADHAVENIYSRLDEVKKFDKEAAYRGGGEMSLFYPHAWWGVDMESVANTMTNAGCFYPSMHFAWHYDDANFELSRTFYMQASQMRDYFKGGWCGAIEATGGPQQFSGGKGGNGFTVDENVMTQFILSQIAAGFKGFGMWCWNTRTAGWEAGEYALLDRNNEVTARAIKVGAIGKAMVKYRDELWNAHKEPYVGVLVDWNSDAIWAAMSKSGRDVFKQNPVSARIGVSRALINANVPYEYVTPNDLKKGLSGRYKVIYLPYELSVDPAILLLLTDYAKKGGRVVADLPTCWYNQYAALSNTGKGAAFEQLFGVTLNDFQYAGVNIPYSINGLELKGFTADIVPTKAGVLSKYDNGKPAVTENKLGNGSAVLLGYEASMLCFKPGNTSAEQNLLTYSLGTLVSPYACKGAFAYRLATPGADHYFVINDGPATQANLTFKNYHYKKATDAVTGEELPLNQPIALDPWGGRWLRFEK